MIAVWESLPKKAIPVILTKGLVGMRGEKVQLKLEKEMRTAVLFY